MTPRDDVEYYRSRARAARAMAAQATDPSAAAAHGEMARRYEALTTRGAAIFPSLRLVEDD